MQFALVREVLHFASLLHFMFFICELFQIVMSTKMVGIENKSDMNQIKLQGTLKISNVYLLFYPNLFGKEP